MRYADIYLIKNELVFCSSATTTVGLLLSIAPYIHLPEDANDDEIVSAINTVIEANQYKIPHPKQDEWTDFGKNRLKNLGLKSYKEEYAIALVCSVEENEKSFLFFPTRNEGARKGYTFISDSVIEISKKESNEKIAAALREALDICKQNDERQKP